jgi:hypothetical protein
MVRGNFKNSLRMNDLHAPNLPRFQPYLNAMRMKGRFGQNVLYHAFGQIPTALILFQHDGHFQSGMNIFSFGSC